jgi:hypothetical protein
VVAASCGATANDDIGDHPPLRRLASGRAYEKNARCGCLRVEPVDERLVSKPVDVTVPGWLKLPPRPMESVVEVTAATNPYE